MSSPTAAAARLPGDERRSRILDAALKVFAKRGFHGATTRELAKAAGVSEALMYRHFATKEDLYVALQFQCCQAKAGEKAEMLSKLEDSTASLVMLVHHMMAKTLRPVSVVPEAEQSLHRLLANSIIEDGSFARGFMQRVGREFVQKVQSCLEAAIRAGDATASPVQKDVGPWFVQLFAAMLMLNEMPGRPVVSLESDHASQVQQAVWFALQGLGLKPEAISRLYHLEAFNLLMS